MQYKVSAIRYATRTGRRANHFVGGDHDGPMPMDYFVWVCQSPERTFVVDTGFTVEEAQRRGREFLRCPVDSLKLLGIDAKDVTDVILTHLHYDHAGNCDRFPNARFHVQEKEVAHATGRYMGTHIFAHSYRCEDICAVVSLNFQSRVVFHDGTRELAPGLSVHRVGGHTPGLQCVRVQTEAGPLVLASDAAHYYEHFEINEPFSIVVNVMDMLDGYTLLRDLAGPGGRIIPGHDPKVMQLYPAPHPALQGVVVRLD